MPGRFCECASASTDDAGFGKDTSGALVNYVESASLDMVQSSVNLSVDKTRRYVKVPPTQATRPSLR